MAKTKKNPLIEAFKRSASGWVKGFRYVNSGKWADDFSKAVHRSGASKRAQQRAKVAVKGVKIGGTEKQVEFEKVSTHALGQEAMSKLSDKHPDMNFWLEDVKEQNPKSTNGTYLHAAIRNAQKAAAKQVTDVSAHGRKGSKGVAAHQRKLNPAEQRAKTASKLLEIES